MASMEEDFPRGGTAKTSTESKVVRERADVDNLFEEHKPKESKKRKLGKKDVEKNKKPKLSKEEALKLNVVSSVAILHLKNVKVGTLLLGCVKEVSDFEVMVSLPSNLLGYLSVSNISDSYSKILSDQLDSGDAKEIFSFPNLFSPGMLVRCVVARLDITNGGNISIQLSINPKEVNRGLGTASLKVGMILSGSVESVEDHGYLLDIGISGTKAFLPKQAANAPKELQVGQYVTSLLEEVKNDARVVRLSASPTVVAQACADTQHGWTLNNLLPGLLVKAQVKKVTTHGLILEFLSSFTGCVDFMHMEANLEYSEGDNVKACVLYVEPSTRLVGLSVRNHLVQQGGVIESVTSERIGEVVKDCKMTSLHHHSGAILELPDKTPVFVHKNHMKEPKDPFNLNRVLAKPQHTCKIMDYSPLEQLHLVSLRKTMIEAPFFRYHDLHAGQVVDCTVTSLQSFGMMVRLTDHIKGMVPRSHLADIILQNPEKKYSTGMKIKCRVLSVDPQQKKLTLTRKKALVDSTLPLFLTYEDARRGRVSHGFIVCVKDFGCIVRFYGDVKGLVPIHELSTEPVIVPEKMFYMGQVVKAKVLNCDVEKEKLLLSFKATGGTEPEVPPKPQYTFEIGKKVDAKVLSKVLNGLEVSILPEETPALLPTTHLSDHISNCSLLWESLQEGDIISNIVCLSKSKQNITLTKKPTLKAALEEGVATKEFSDLQVGMQMIGWVKNIMPYGVFVEFPYGLVGLAPKSAMSDKFLSNTASSFQLGQTVAAKVTDLDEEKHRFLVSLRVSEIISPEGEGQARLIRGLQERKALAGLMANRGDSELHKQLSATTVGQKLKMTVDKVMEDGGATFKSDELSGAAIQATKHHTMGVTVTPGQQVTAVVLYFDLSKSAVHVSLRPKLVAKRKRLVEGSKHDAFVQHTDLDFAVVSLGDTAQVTVIQTTNHLNDWFHTDSEKLMAGKIIKVTVTEPSCEEIEGLPLVSWELTAPKRERKVSERDPAGSKGGYRYGDVVKGTVKTIKPTLVLVSLEDNVVGSVHVSEMQEVVCVGTFPTSYLKIGSEVTARVIGGREANTHRFLNTHRKYTYAIPELSLIPSKLQEDVDLEPIKKKGKLKDYEVGQEIICFVSKYVSDKKYLELCMSPCVTGSVELLAMTSDPQDCKHPERKFKLGQAVSAKVVEVSSSKPVRLSLSLTDIHKLEKGCVTMGMVQKVQPHFGLLVKLPFGGMGTVSVADLADTYRLNPLEPYSKDQLIRCCIVGDENGKWQLSLRPSRVNPEKPSAVKDPEVLSIDDLTEGQIIRGYVKSVAEQGIFVRLSRSITGRAEVQLATKYFVSNRTVLVNHVSQNTLLTTKILSIDKTNGLVNLSLLSEDTGKPDVLPESLGLKLRLTGEEKEKHDATRKRKLSVSESKPPAPEETEKVAKKKKKTKKGKTEDSDSGVEVYFREEEEEGGEEEEKKAETTPATKPVKPAPARLQVSGGFSWDAALSALKPASAALGGDSSEGEDEGEEQSKPRKKTRHEQEQEKKQAEKALTKLETELMDPGLRPQSAESFERLLLSSPDSSLLWLQYMAFHLQATQIEQARAVAERALKTISFREEQEKLNVWVALLNLENLYGTEDSLQKVFERALQYCEPMPVYQQLADIYAKSEKNKEAETLYKTMVKRFRQDKAVWLSYGAFLLRQGQSDAASALLQRALKSLPSKDNVDLIAKFAQLEFRYGDVERGKSMLDKILTSYPKRTDLWSVFIDLMVKHGSQKDVRDLFDRVIHLSVAVKRIKFFFKRYLEYEKKNGTPESIMAVKEKALEYVESKGTEAAS